MDTRENKRIEMGRIHVINHDKGKGKPMGTYSLLVDFPLFKARLKTSCKIFTTVLSWLMDIWVCYSTLGSFQHSFNISVKIKKHSHPFLR